eukprot:161679-Chlamydomonas_euryale.AAC.1
MSLPNDHPPIESPPVVSSDDELPPPSTYHTPMAHTPTMEFTGQGDTPISMLTPIEQYEVQPAPARSRNVGGSEAPAVQLRHSRRLA